MNSLPFLFETTAFMKKMILRTFITLTPGGRQQSSEDHPKTKAGSEQAGVSVIKRHYARSCCS